MNWLEAPTVQFHLTGSPSKTNLFKESQGKLFQAQKTQKLQSLKRKHSKFIFIEKKTVWIDFIQKDPCKKSLKKTTKSIQIIEEPKKTSYPPWKLHEKKCYLEIHWIQFRYWKSQKIFSFKRNPPKWTSFTRKSRKLISPKEKSKKSTPTARIQRKLFLKTGKSKRRVFFARPWEQNMLIGKSCNKFLLKILLKISFMEKNSVEIVFFWFKKFHGNQFRRFQNDQIEFVNEGSGGLFYRNRLHENCLHQWWNKNQYHFTVGNARWTVFIQVQCKETGFFERKSTNFIHMQPSEVFVNDQKALKIDIIRKEPNSQSTLEKRSWKNLCW